MLYTDRTIGQFRKRSLPVLITAVKSNHVKNLRSSVNKTTIAATIKANNFRNCSNAWST